MKKQLIDQIVSQIQTKLPSWSTKDVQSFANMVTKQLQVAEVTPRAVVLSLLKQAKAIHLCALDGAIEDGNQQAQCEAQQEQGTAA